MAIAYDNSKTYNFSAGSSSTTFVMSAVVGGILLAVTSTKVTACTYNSVSLTKVVDFEPSINDGNQVHVNVWRLTNPATGSNTFDVTHAGDGTVVLASYTGVDEIYQPIENATAYSNDGVNNTQVLSLTNTITTSKDKSWVILCARGVNSTNTFVAGGGTIRVTGNFIFGDGAGGIYDTNGPVTPAGNQSMTSTWSASTGFTSNVIISLSPKNESGGLLSFFP